MERECFIPSCPNNMGNSPDKLFVKITESLAEEWCKLVNAPYYKYYSLYCCEDHLSESLQDKEKESKPKFFLNNSGEVIKRTEQNGFSTDVVVSVSSLKGKQPVSGDIKVKKSKTETSQPRSASVHISSSDQLNNGRDRRCSRIELALPTDL